MGARTGGPTHVTSTAGERRKNSTPTLAKQNPLPAEGWEPGRIVRLWKRAYLSLDLRSLPAANLTFFEALIFSGCPVFGLMPMRALRFAILKVPNPTSCTGLPF